MSNAYHSAPAIGAATVTTSDTTNLTTTSRAVWVGGGGNLSVEFYSGSQVTIENIADGTLLPIKVVRVNATGTSATSILALY